MRGRYEEKTHASEPAGVCPKGSLAGGGLECLYFEHFAPAVGAA